MDNIPPRRSDGRQRRQEAPGPAPASTTPAPAAPTPPDLPPTAQNSTKPSKNKRVSFDSTLDPHSLQPLIAFPPMMGGVIPFAGLSSPSKSRKEKETRAPSSSSRRPSQGSQASASTIPRSSSSDAPSTASSVQPPWDRTVEIIWVRETSSGRGEDEQRIELAFQENCKRLRRKFALNQCQPEETTENSAKNGEATDRQLAPGEQLQDSRHKPHYDARARNRNSRYFQLPDSIRFKIVRTVLQIREHDGKAIRMNSPVYLRAVWPVNSKKEDRRWSTDYFDSLEAVLISLASYTSVCFDMRVDVLATLFLTRRFHVVFSPLMTARIQPTAVLWMNHFGPLMASITLEVDFSKQGGNWAPGAAKINSLPGMEDMAQLVDDFVCAQLTRMRKTTIQDLRILVRRYHGYRPTTAKSTASDVNKPEPEADPSSRAPVLPASTPIRYTQPAHIRLVLEPLKRLRSLVDKITITGAPQDLATELILVLAGKDHPLYTPEDKQREMDTHCTHRRPAREYPFTPGPGQRSMLDYGLHSDDKSGKGRAGLRGLAIHNHPAEEDWEGLYGCRVVAGSSLSPSVSACASTSARDFAGIGTPLPTPTTERRRVVTGLVSPLPVGGNGAGGDGYDWNDKDKALADRLRKMSKKWVSKASMLRKRSDSGGSSGSGGADGTTQEGKESV